LNQNKLNIKDFPYGNPCIHSLSTAYSWLVYNTLVLFYNHIQEFIFEIKVNIFQCHDKEIYLRIDYFCMFYKDPIISLNYI